MPYATYKITLTVPTTTQLRDERAVETTLRSGLVARFPDSRLVVLDAIAWDGSTTLVALWDARMESGAEAGPLARDRKLALRSAITDSMPEAQVSIDALGPIDQDATVSPDLAALLRVSRAA